MISRKIPFSFTQDRKALTWREVEIGIREGWLEPCSAISLAIAKSAHDDVDPNVLQLAGVFKEDQHEIAPLVATLASLYPGNSKEDAYLTWMRLILAWIYENRAALSDPLLAVEQIYADFGYPEEIRYIVRYNPPAESVPHTEGSESEIMKRWHEYLVSCLAHPDQDRDSG